MPIPFILGALGITAGIIGAGAHLSAKEKNEYSELILLEAETLYNNSKKILEEVQKNMESSLLVLGYQKKEILETSFKQFLKAYERVKDIEIKDSIGLNELSKFTLEKQDAIQLREMTNIYESAFSSSVTGAATGAVIALAASGSLPVVTGVLSTAGSAIMAGEIGIATGLAGSALSFGAAMTPLGAIAAPVILFTGISSSIKAEENLEKAKTTYKEVELAVENMEKSKDICEAIMQRSNMFNDMLKELNIIFYECTKLLDGVTLAKMGLFKNKKIKSYQLTESEIKLIATTRALAGAIKSIIDTPIIGEDGYIHEKSQEVYDNVENNIENFRQVVQEIKQIDFKVKPREIKQIDFKAKPREIKQKKSKNESIIMKDFFRNTFAIILASFLGNYLTDLTASLFVGVCAFTFILLSIMNIDTKIKIFKFVKNIGYFSLYSIFCVLFYKYSENLLNINKFLLYDILAIIIFVIIFGVLSDSKIKIKSLNSLFLQITLSILLFAFALLVFAFLYKFLGLSLIISKICPLIIYAFFELIIFNIDDFYKL